MFATANPNKVCYKCTRCNRNPLGYTKTDKRTVKRHTQNDNDRNMDKTINEQIVLTAKVNTSEADMNIDQIEEHIEYDNYSVGAPSPEQYVNTYLSLLVEESLFETEEYTSEYECEYESSDEFEQEEQNREQEQVYRKPFREYLALNEGAVILITFINIILKHYGENFRLPTSIPGLRKMIGYNDLTNGISKYVACSNCHTLYNYSNNTHTSCNFKRVGSVVNEY
ncbi:hypothetical protein PHYBLDRAFT_166613 [Phycomyces blakesleeanus NRRL 1555(-)]|uniref:Uncharacterized protein n=1 Tax=Phycomyces blakesleeanus (strain ATCC 8743b / DSM 1359 / FGSC 10004 / NBRC 33097 / NRRL 1555) TaxID=763407 RepID=A0A167N8X8_PHYB8|nr:hypothetical protein PHYBLDRAFT_166613 [Phycomyces blakesleeanus NRRL 1555(-)]OAD75364.1 hypothetical protein PHYBLDRAFT_166613 [Phycomyces blakesleeanus NRRL 1555(-)]|eukprot:XP_018293404.1 hypothetical protein PHYBLDRAFT_166613 [Phycomyces blakesleeanus NRRL 1555(-)]